MLKRGFEWEPNVAEGKLGEVYSCLKKQRFMVAHLAEQEARMAMAVKLFEMKRHEHFLQVKSKPQTTIK